jgi:hypothetical protein
LTSAIDTLVAFSAFGLEPRGRFGFVDDREDLDPVFFDVIEHPHFSDSEPVLRTGEAAKTLDSAAAELLWLMAQMALDRVDYLPSKMRTQGSELPRCFRRQNDIARLAKIATSGGLPAGRAA